MTARRRPQLELEMAHLGRIDPFQLTLREFPPGSGEYRVALPKGSQEPLPVERAGLCLVGASQALMSLSLRWLTQAGRDPAGDTGLPEAGMPAGEMRMVVRRREARLMGSLLRRHVARLPEAPKWMQELLDALDEMDEFLRWQET
ncbi:MAG: hypothetical protein ACYTGZ_07560 [Planctomycetota bacterium]|jgi:hypothetical protein